MTRRTDVEAVTVACAGSIISTETCVPHDWPLRCVRAVARASNVSDANAVVGYGGGSDVGEATTRAVAECLERYAQFRTDPPPPSVTAPWQAVREEAISPLRLGLYDSAQYAAPEFPCRPFDSNQPIEWIQVTDLLDGTKRLVPYEAVYPNAPIQRAPIVRETSTGCAAHPDAAVATLAAVCEVVERDSAMLFWYRQPPTATLIADDIDVPGFAEDLDDLRRLGYVVVVASLDYDLGIPCFLAIALRASRFAYGLGCHAEMPKALAHAIRELECNLAWLHLSSFEDQVPRRLAAVTRPDDHYRLYNCGPRHNLLRQVLARTLGPHATTRLPRSVGQIPQEPKQALIALVGALGVHGLRAYACRIGDSTMAERGLHVVRVLIPGLVPLHFGFDRLRLGCQRLSGENSPGRLRHLLPHFMH